MCKAWSPRAPPPPAARARGAHRRSMQIFLNKLSGPVGQLFSPYKELHVSQALEWVMSVYMYTPGVLNLASNAALNKCPEVLCRHCIRSATSINILSKVTKHTVRMLHDRARRPGGPRREDRPITCGARTRLVGARLGYQAPGTLERRVAALCHSMLHIAL